MPKETIELPYQIEYWSVLDEDGHLDKDLLPELENDTLREMYRIMLLSRRFDERQLSLQRQGRIGTFAPVKGQEAAQIGAVATLQDKDWMVPAFRETAAMIWRGTPLPGILLYNAGYNEGGRIPDEQNDLPIAIPVASQIPHAVGIAYAMLLRADEKVVMTFFGDGATSEGDFHEALNFAGVYQVPVVFICQNNQWAISLPREQQTATKTLAQKALAYGVPAIQADGNDLFAVYAAAKQAVGRARSGKGPTLIECVTYRLEVHTTADDPSRYREDKEVKKWEKRDPLPRLQKYLQSEELLSEDDIEAMEDEIEKTLDSAWQEAEKQMKEMSNPAVMFEHLYAELPPYLQAQKAAFEAIQKSRKESDDG